MKWIALLLPFVLSVGPSETWTNLDGVRLDVSHASGGSATIAPSLGSPWSKTQVRCLNGFKGVVDGLDATDTVVVHSGARAHIEGTPFEVTLSAGCAALIVNTAPTAPGAGGGAGIYYIRVHLPGGAMAAVPSSTSVLFTP